MSIASEINRIKSNISDAYTTCGENMATMPQTENSENLSQTISTIGHNIIEEIENGEY